MKYDLIMVFLISIIIHEIGHIIGYLLFRKKFPPIHFRWWGVKIGDKKFIKPYTLKQMAIIAFMGIYSGLLYLIIINVKVEILLIYLLISFLDFNIIFSWATNKEFSNSLIGNLKTIDVTK